MARFIGVLALVASCGLLAGARVAPYEYAMPPLVVRATPLMPSKPLLRPAPRSARQPLCQPNVCDVDVLCDGEQCITC